MRFVEIPRLLRMTVTAGTAAACLMISPMASAAVPGGNSTGTVLITNGLWADRVLCASPNDDSVWLQTITFGNPYCQWNRIGATDHFVLYNAAKGKVMAYEGGNEQPLVMRSMAFPTPDSQAFSLGNRERWGAYALQSFLDKGQNVDAKESGTDNPRTTEPVRTRGWRHGHQMELTWDMVTVP
ncbi:hypothetical protein ACFYRL_13195 [Streptomyces goshikiensis]|uniref:hypothetical protein n=1 Tax=Streptomyces goshikiensis TaxID=1942 RepID=UPI0036D1B5AF